MASCAETEIYLVDYISEHTIPYPIILHADVVIYMKPLVSKKIMIEGLHSILPRKIFQPS